MHGRRLLLSRTSVAGAKWRSSVAEVCIEPGFSMICVFICGGFSVVVVSVPRTCVNV